jgi:hypothetical protein
MIASSSLQLGWLAPHSAPVSPTAEPVVAAAAVSPDLQQLTLGLASVRQSVDQLAFQLAAVQRQMASEIAKLQADEQELLQKLSAAPARPTATPARKPPAVKPPSPPTEAP